jgi:hypothetical protein
MGRTPCKAAFGPILRRLSYTTFSRSCCEAIPTGINEKMETDFAQVELIEDALLIANCNAEARENGALLICHRCFDAEAPIVAILIVTDQESEAWALCGPCLGQIGLRYYA